MDQSFTEGERGTQIPSPASAMTTAAEGNRAAESDTESKRREPIFSPVSAMQTAAKLNSRAESNNGTHIPSPASAMQTARQEDTRQLKSTDSKRRAEILSPASITSAATVGFKATPLAATTLPESKHMGLDTVAISIATDEESTPVELVIAAKDGAGSVQDYWNTVATSIAAAEEIRLVCFCCRNRSCRRRTAQGTAWTQWQLKMPLAKQAPCIVQRGRKILRRLATPST